MIAQPVLPGLFDLRPMPANCARGVHPELVDSAPDVREESVNIDHTCLTCGVRVAVTSWSREAWDTRKVI